MRNKNSRRGTRTRGRRTKRKEGEGGKEGGRVEQVSSSKHPTPLRAREGDHPLHDILEQVSHHA